jgi:hypothetical protein
VFTPWRGIADLVGCNVAALVACGGPQSNKSCTEQRCRDRDDDQNDCAGGHMAAPITFRELD